MKWHAVGRSVAAVPHGLQGPGGRGTEPTFPEVGLASRPWPGPALSLRGGPGWLCTWTRRRVHRTQEFPYSKHPENLVFVIIVIHRQDAFHFLGY